VPRRYLGTHRRKTWASTLVGWTLSPTGLAAAFVLLAVITFGVAQVVAGPPRGRLIPSIATSETSIGASRPGVVSATPPTSTIGAVRGSQREGTRPGPTVTLGRSPIGTSAAAAGRGTRTGPAVTPSPSPTQPTPSRVTVPTTTSTSSATSPQITTPPAPATTTTTDPKPPERGTRRHPTTGTTTTLAPGNAQ
jgi:hypothetical protein